LTEIDLARSTNEVQDLNLILNSLFLTKQAFDEQVDILKGLSLKIFYDVLEYGQDEVDKWLVDYSAQSEEIEQALHSIYIDLRKLENEFFNIKIWDEINVAPMKSYIEEWLQRGIKKLIDQGKKPVGTIPVVIDESNKKASTGK